MSEPDSHRGKEAGKIVEGACASLEACPRLQPRGHGQACFAEMPDEELLFDVADLFKGPSPTPPASRSCPRSWAAAYPSATSPPSSAAPKAPCEPPAAHAEAGAPS